MKWTNYKSIDNGKKTEITYPDGTKEIIDIEFDKYMDTVMDKLIEETK